MRAGQLRHRLIIQEITSTSGTFGSNTKALWTDVLTVWGSVRPMMGKEAELAQQMAAETSHTIVLRFPDPAVVTVSALQTK